MQRLQAAEKDSAVLRARDAKLQTALAEKNLENLELRWRLAAAREATNPSLAQVSNAFHAPWGRLINGMIAAYLECILTKPSSALPVQAECGMLSDALQTRASSAVSMEPCMQQACQPPWTRHRFYGRVASDKMLQLSPEQAALLSMLGVNVGSAACGRRGSCCWTRQWCASSSGCVARRRPRRRRCASCRRSCRQSTSARSPRPGASSWPSAALCRRAPPFPLCVRGGARSLPPHIMEDCLHVLLVTGRLVAPPGVSL